MMLLLAWAIAALGIVGTLYIGNPWSYPVWLGSWALALAVLAWPIYRRLRD